MYVHYICMHVIKFTFRSICGCVGTPITFNEVMNNCVIYPISKAWCLGRAVQRGRIAKSDPVNAILDSVSGKLIISGMVITLEIILPCLLG